MTDPTPTSERLEALKARWESDKGSRVFLQLADEHRRLGRLGDAIAVLDEGLRSNRGHLGARVARARCLVELGRAGEAVGDLEKVIEADPTQMVAYRLLVDAYIQQGDADRARQRLRVYGLLNDSDPEIEELSRSIDQLERGGAPPSPTGSAGPAEAAETAETAGPAEPEAGADAGLEDIPLTTDLPNLDELGDLPDLDEPAGETPFPETLPQGREPAEPAEPAASTEPFDLPEVPEAPETAPVPDVPDPFPSLAPSETDRRSEPSLDEDLFAAPPSEAAEAKPEPALPVGEPPLETEPGTEPEPGPAEAPAADTAAERVAQETEPEAEPDLFAAGGPEAAKPAGEPAGPGPSGDSDDLFDLGPPSTRAAAPNLDELFGDVPQPEAPPPAVPAEEALASAIPAAPAPEPPGEPGSEEVPEPEPEPEAVAEEVAPPEDIAPPPAPEPEPEPSFAPPEEGRPTVTLGRLYLRQGHLGEAETIFREVLVREPGNEEARRGLEEVLTQAASAPDGASGPGTGREPEIAEAAPEAESRPDQVPAAAPELDVTELLEGYDPAAHGEGLTARKRFALGRYRERIRGGGRDVH
jgi:tetratricopeptide (TPR) repeat protein